ncbi:MAG: hypothetical protein LBE13_19070, partial [Bacteroidales bacterium]|nr:hypothetical protein [Bacteroidales bacterium]
DSLYQAYIPIVQNTKNDWEYCKAIQRFLVHFNSGHTDIYDIPHYLTTCLARPYIQTSYNDSKIIIDNVGEFQSEELQIGDEIVTMDRMLWSIFRNFMFHIFVLPMKKIKYIKPCLMEVMLICYSKELKLHWVLKQIKE